jgi:hypothetical protein
LSFTTSFSLRASSTLESTFRRADFIRSRFSADFSSFWESVRPAALETPGRFWAEAGLERTTQHTAARKKRWFKVYPTRSIDRLKTGKL